MGALKDDKFKDITIINWWWLAEGITLSDLKRLKRLPNSISTNWHFQRPLDAFFETLNRHWIFIHDFRLCRLKNTPVVFIAESTRCYWFNVFTLLLQSLQFPLLIYIGIQTLWFSFILILWTRFASNIIINSALQHITRLDYLCAILELDFIV